MMHIKKISVDVLQIALILTFVRFGPEVLFSNQRHEALEVGQTFLGATVGYRRFSSPNNYALTHRYVNLKTLDSLIMDRTTILRDQLSNLRNYGEHRNDIYAYYNEQNAKVPDSASNEAAERNSSDANPPFNPSTESWPSGHDGNRRESVELLETFQDTSVVDLSPEDMGLIEILWKQDIDLGVSREAYSSFDSHQTEKAKVETEFTKATEVNVSVKAKSNSDKKYNHDIEDSKPEFVNQWEGLNYTVDNETGEYILQDQKLDEEEQDLPSELSLFTGDGFDDLSASLFANENDTSNFNFTKLPLDDDDEVLQQPLDDFLSNLDDLFAEVEKLEENVRETETGNVNQSEGSEMYPSMEEYWQDISTTLPLSVMGGPYAPSVPIVPRPVRAYPIPSEMHTDVLSSSSEFLARANDTFQGSFLQNSTIAPRSPDMNTTFGCLPSMLGSTSLGCAVASSIATLTNDTDPMPDVSGVLNGTYGLDLPAMLHPNQTSTLPTSNETLMSDLLMVDDLQFMDTAAASSAVNSDEASCHTLTIGNENMELSNDSVVSSISGSTSSVSACNENQRTSFEDVSAIECSSKDSAYTTLKYPVHSPYMNPGYRQLETSAHNHNCGFNASSYRNRDDYGHYLQHNHSYHLPFTNCNTSPKPVTRDKSRPGKYCSDDEDAHNRDEKRAKALKLPITINDIINLGIEEFNEKITKFDLTESQQTLIRDIRRRGKNKVAAQNCRKRKMDQITNLQEALDCLETERLQLESERAQLLHQRRSVRDKYTQLCQFVIQSTNHRQRIPNVFPSTLDNNSVAFTASTPPTSDSSKSDDTLFSQGVRAKKKIEKRRLDYP